MAHVTPAGTITEVILTPSGRDDTAMLLAALTDSAGHRVGGPNGHRIYLNNGTYKVSGQIADLQQIQNGVNIRGAGRNKTVLQVTADLGVGTPLLATTGVTLTGHTTWIDIADLLIQGSSHTFDVFHFAYCSGLSLRRVQVLNAKGTPLVLTEVWDSELRDIQLVGSGDHANGKAGGMVMISTDPTDANTSCNNIRTYTVQVEDYDYYGVEHRDQTRVCTHVCLKVHGTQPTPAAYAGVVWTGAANCALLEPRLTNGGADQVLAQNGAHSTSGGNRIIGGTIDGAGSVSGAGYGLNNVNSPDLIVDGVDFGMLAVNASGNINDPGLNCRIDSTTVH